MIFIHPTLIHQNAQLARLQLACGLRLEVGRIYLRLVNLRQPAQQKKQLTKAPRVINFRKGQTP